MEELQKFLVVGRSRLNVRQDKALIITGSTGVGKSTLSHLFGNSKVLSVETADYDLKLQVDENDPRKLGHNLLESETTIPNHFQRIVRAPPTPSSVGAASSSRHVIHNIWDTPGYSDTGDQETKSYIKEIANSFYTCHLINNIDQIKILFVTSEDSLSNAKCKFLIESLENLAKMFSDVSILQNSVAICINKVRERKIKKNPRLLLQPLLQGNVLSDNAKWILRYTENSTHVFEKIEGQGEITDDGLYDRIMESIKEYIDIKALKAKSTSGNIVNMTISQQGYSLAKPLLDESQTSLRQALAQFTDIESLQKQQLIENFGDKQQDQRVFFQKVKRRYERGDTFLEDIQNPDQVKMSQVVNDRELYSNVFYLDDICTLNDILQCFDIEKLQVIHIKVIIKQMFQVFERNSYTSDKDEYLTQQQDTINEKLEFIDFIQQIKVANGGGSSQNAQQPRSMQHDLFEIKGLFREFKQALSKLEHIFINSYKIDVNGLNPYLYQKIFDTLNRDRFDQSTLLPSPDMFDTNGKIDGHQKSGVQDQVTLLKAKCRIEMIKIQFAQDKYGECIQMIEESIKLFRNSSCTVDLQIFQILANLVYIDHDHVDRFQQDVEVLDQLFKVFRYRLHKSVEESVDLLNEIGIRNGQKYLDSQMALLRDVNKLRTHIKNLWKLNFQTNEQNWKKNLIQQYKKTQNFVTEVITTRQLGIMTPESLTKFNEQLKLKFEMNLLALNEIFKRKELIVNPSDPTDQKRLQRQLDSLTDWIHLLDKTQERLESELKELINNIDIQPNEVEKYSIQEIEDIMQISSSMPESSSAKRCFAKGLLCQGLKLQVKQPQSEQDEENNKRAMDCFMAALAQDNGLNMARKLIADLHFKQQNYEIAAQYYHDINNFMQAELCFKLICQYKPNIVDNVVRLADYQRAIGLYNDAKRTLMEAIQLSSGQNHTFDEDLCHVLFQKLDEVRQEECSSLNVFAQQARNKQAIFPQSLPGNGEDLG